jgi:hypothetical protein
MKKIISYLITTTALLILSAVAMAQGGLTPFAGSTHVYTVTAEDDINNTLAWTVSGGILNTDFTINSGASTEQVEITWLNTGTYTVSFSETADGTLCITNKEATVIVGSNTFDVSTSDPVATCNAADGQINVLGPDTTTSITYTVNMTTSSSFSPDWRFSFTLTSGTGATVDNVKVGGTTVAEVSGTYTSPDQTSTSGNGTVAVTMDVTGGINDLEDMVLEITSATELTYSTSDVDSNDWTASQTINPIPATSDIATD